MRVSDITYTGLSEAGRFSATLPQCPRGVGYPLPAQHPGTPAGRRPDILPPARPAAEQSSNLLRNFQFPVILPNQSESAA